MSKQTAVEWLIDELSKNNVSTNSVIERINNEAQIWKQAKAMEREQIEDAYWEGGQDVPSNGKQCEKYYNETYKGDNK